MKKLLPFLLSAFSLGAQAQTAPAWTWAKMLASSNLTSAGTMTTDAAGNTYLAGSFSQPLTLAPGTVLTTSSGQDGFVAKYDPSGALLWSRQLAGFFNDGFQKVLIDGTGKVTLVGMSSDGAQLGSTTFSSNSFGPVAVLTKLDAQGQVLSITEVGSGSYLIVADLALDAAGNSYISGTFGLSAAFGNFSLTTPIAGTSIAFDQFLVKVSPQGTPLWAQQGGRAVAPAGTGTNFYYNSLAVEPGGNVYLTWTCNANAGGFGALTMPAGYGDLDVVVVKYNTQGTPQWLQRAGSPGLDFAGNTALDANGRLVVPGFVTGAGTFGSQTLAGSAGVPSGYVWTLTPAAGASSWVRGLGGAVGAAYRGVTADAAGNIYAAGQFSGAGTLGSATLPNAGGLDGLIVSYSAAGNVNWSVKTGGVGDESPLYVSLDGTNRLAVAGILNGAGLFGTTALTGQNAPVGNLFVAHLGAIVTATRSAQPVAQLALYPNPASATEAVNLPPLPAGTSLTLTDALGRVVRRPAGLRLALDGLAAGVYVVQATAPDGQQWTNRLVVK
ncbi:T9SS type A sorting domain-containing protein [Hymenobacter rubidus]|uniref:T9SS type A sorting domain-containing protein n=1 Tax=Hymenobacter rubidus TaxID=1441626 RepID=UPI00191F2299|nr:T9SS type A sorting domain-containing protein [Hymenobacter rubidus]